MITRALIAFVWISILFFGCSDTTNSNNSVISLELSDSILLPLDEETGHYYNTFQISEYGSIPLFHFYNSNNKQVYIYNLSDRTLAKKIRLSKDGKDGIGNLANIDIAINDSVLYVLNSDYQRLYQFDTNGKKIKVVTLDSLNTIYENKIAYADASASYPMVMDKRKSVFLNSTMYGVKPDIQNYYSFWQVNLKSQKPEVIPWVPYPSIYQKGNYGNTLHYHVSFCLIEDSLLAVSFAREDSLRIYNTITGNLIKSMECRSDLFDVHSMEPLVKDPAGKEAADAERVLYEFTNPYYFKLFFDHENQEFIRLAVSQTPTKEEVSRNGGDKRKGMGLSVIRYSKNGLKTGEWLLPKDIYYIGCTYLYNSKIYVIPKPRYQTFEDKLTIHIYNLPD